MNLDTEKDTLLNLKKGSSDDFEKLFNMYGAKLYHFVLKLSSGNKYLAEEMVQRTFIKIWETHTSVNPDKSFISYLCTIAKNMLVNEYEHQTVEYIYREYILQFYPNAENDTEKQVNKNLLEEFIDNLIEKLPPARKQVYVLSKKEMLSNKEIANKLQISESTVQTQLAKAVSFMKEHLTKYYDKMLTIILTSIFVN